MRIVEVERFYCDCCGIEVTSFYSRFTIPHLWGDDEYEMCRNCHDKFHKFLKGFIKVKNKSRGKK